MNESFEYYDAIMREQPRGKYNRSPKRQKGGFQS